MRGKQANVSVSIFPAGAVSTASAWILTEVKHGWNKSPSDDKLAALEQLLQPLLGLFAHFSHVSVSDGEDAVTPAKDTVKGSDVMNQAWKRVLFCDTDTLWRDVGIEVGNG